MKFHCQSNTGCLNLGSHDRYRSYLAQVKHEWQGRNEYSLWKEWQVGGGMEVVLTTASSTGSSAWVSSPGSSTTAGVSVAGGSSVSGSVVGACSDSAFDYLFWRLEKKDSTYEYIALQNTRLLRFCSSSYRQAALLRLSWKKVLYIWHHGPLQNWKV